MLTVVVPAVSVLTVWKLRRPCAAKGAALLPSSRRHENNDVALTATFLATVQTKVINQ